MIFIGIDPGASGGIAGLNYDGHVVEALKMPQTERDIYDYVGSFTGGNGESCKALIEKVHAMPKQGVSSTFKFGVGYGGLRMALVGHGIPFEDATPQKWQAFMGCLTRGDKNVSKAKAQMLWPRLKVTHAIADALLIAEYLRRTSTF